MFFFIVCVMISSPSHNFFLPLLYISICPRFKNIVAVMQNISIVVIVRREFDFPRFQHVQKFKKKQQVNISYNKKKREYLSILMRHALL